MRYGLIIDPLLLLDRAFGDGEVLHGSQLKIIEARKKLEIMTGAEAAALSALQFSRHHLFHKGCFKNFAIKKLNNLHAKILNDI
jgi:hypothetical protein